MTQNMTYDMTHLSNISNPFLRFFRRVLLLLALLLATAGVKAVDDVSYLKNLYGGGNAADVTGNTNVTIGKAKE